jgi:polynucleotide 5'-hydroxyl-kinase GRC3/NOL9
VSSPEADRVVPAAGWTELTERLRGGGTILVLGEPGAGKSTLARWLVRELDVPAGTAALLSADMGQASVGPPACLGLALAKPWQGAAALWFVGDVTPVANLLPAVVGAAQLTQHARKAGARAVIVDSCGLVAGGLGRVLQYHTALACGVDEVVGLQRAGELESLLRLLEGPSRAVHRLAAAPEARDRTAAERREYREGRFEEHFRNAKLRSFDPGLLLGPDWTPGALLQRPAGTLVGLQDRRGRCLALGLLKELRPERLAVVTAHADPQAVATVHLGKLRLNAYGQELA